MDAADRIAAAFEPLARLDRDGIAARPPAERIVYYVVAARCEIDINSFASVYEQLFTPAEFDLLINGLKRIGEADLAAEFRRGLALLQVDGFYSHMNWSEVSTAVKAQINVIGERVGPRLWELDGKLASLLDKEAAPQ